MNRTHDADLRNANALGYEGSHTGKEDTGTIHIPIWPLFCGFSMPKPDFNLHGNLARNYFFTPRTASFAALATRNLITVLAGILIFCCVLGLKPVRAFLFCFTSLPKPGKTNSPFFLVVL